MHQNFVGISFVAAAGLTAPLGAQWLNMPSKITPHTPDGKVDLSAPMRRTANGKPDLSGIWEVGYSIGKWEGDTLVVHASGFNDRSWLDDDGHPYSDAMQVIERFRRSDFGRLQIEITVDDPKAYTKPWTVKETLHILPDTELMEYICGENEKDVEHLFGK